MFPLEKGPEDDTDEDEDTAANSAQLAEWDGVAPVDSDGDFDGFDSINDSDDDAAVVAERKEPREEGESKGAASKAAFARWVYIVSGVVGWLLALVVLLRRVRYEEEAKERCGGFVV